MGAKALHTPRKRFGQNFLQDPYVIQQIVEVIRPQKGETLVEIGPGLGAITRPLLEAASSLDIIELDRDLVANFRTEYKNAQQLRIHEADALTFDYAALIQEPKQKLRLVGNLPYNISTPLLFHLLKFIDHIQDLHFMLQQEMAERLTAQPNQKAYGKLSILIQYFCKANLLFSVKPNAFYPVPKVQSAFIRLVPYTHSPFADCSLPRLKEVTTAAFNQRRKILANSLKAYLSLEEFEKLAIAPQQRAEQLSIETFVRIANYVANRGREK